MNSAINLEDQVNCGGRDGLVEGIFCDAVALISWDDGGVPSYVAIADLRKASLALRRAA